MLTLKSKKTLGKAIQQLTKISEVDSMRLTGIFEIKEDKGKQQKILFFLISLESVDINHNIYEYGYILGIHY